MEPLIENWIACPTCGGELADDDPGVRCAGCGNLYERKGRWLDLVDTKLKVSSEGPGDTLPMAWRRRRWDELRGPSAPENAEYLAAIWQRLRPDDRVLDLGCGPASILAWMADFAPDLAILGLDLSTGALEEAERAVGERQHIALVRASTRRRLPVRDASCDVVLRRLAPALPEEIVRVLAPGGYYFRFTFAPNHWREVYDLMPGLPRAREDALAGEGERLRALGLEVEEPIRHTGTEEFTSAAVMLALRSNPAAFHADGADFHPLRALWHAESGRRVRTPLTSEYAILVARKPAESVALPPEAIPTIATPPDEPARPKRARGKKPADQPAAKPDGPDAIPVPAIDARAVSEPTVGEAPTVPGFGEAAPAPATDAESAAEPEIVDPELLSSAEVAPPAQPASELPADTAKPLASADLAPVAEPASELPVDTAAPSAAADLAPVPRKRAGRTAAVSGSAADEAAKPVRRRKKPDATDRAPEKEA